MNSLSTVKVCGIVLGLSMTAMTMATDVDGQNGETGDIGISNISGDADKPRRHLRLRQPMELQPDQANLLYDVVRDALQGGYRLSNSPVANEYQGWTRYNTSPYLSSSHGNHYLNNYANSKADAYGSFEKAGKFPVGSIIAKDSFTVTESREIVLGPLSIMEKMPEGFNYVTGNWRYKQIQPDGTLLGETNGRGSERVEYCIACHLTMEKQDHLFFLPNSFRVKSQQ